MLFQGNSGDVDWMNLAAKMFLSRMNNQNSQQKQRAGKKTTTSPSFPPLRTRSPIFSPRARVQDTTPTHLPPDCVATIKQFEALRVQLLRQLVLYQTQLLALKMPPIPGQLIQPVHKTASSKGKMTHKRSNKVKKQTSSKKVKSGQESENKKWEKIQFPARKLENQNKRRSQVFQKPKKSSKKASKRKLEDVQTSIDQYMCDMKLNKTSKKPCHPYPTCLRNYTSSTESEYSSKQGKYDFSFNFLKGKNVDQNNSFTTSSSVKEDKNKSTSISKSPKKKSSKLNKKISSAFVFDTPTDEA